VPQLCICDPASEFPQRGSEEEPESTGALVDGVWRQLSLAEQMCLNSRTCSGSSSSLEFLEHRFHLVTRTSRRFRVEEHRTGRPTRSVRLLGLCSSLSSGMWVVDERLNAGGPAQLEGTPSSLPNPALRRVAEDQSCANTTAILRQPWQRSLGSRSAGVPTLRARPPRQAFRRQRTPAVRFAMREQPRRRQARPASRKRPRDF
jgi:hypothetical protein